MKPRRGVRPSEKRHVFKSALLKGRKLGVAINIFLKRGARNGKLTGRGKGKASLAYHGKGRLMPNGREGRDNTRFMQETGGFYGWSEQSHSHR
jgi:hypothetical protein